MAIRNKIILPNSYYFITFTFLNWAHICTSEKYFTPFYTWFTYQQTIYKNKVHAYVIMPNHFHGLFYISETSPPLPKVIQNGKRFIAYEIIKLLHEDKHQSLLYNFAISHKKTNGALHRVFEPRYDAKLLENEELILQKLHYIHMNPCQTHWQLVDSPEEYTHSSAANYIGGNGHYPVDLLDFG